jgi:hypothetical protein
MISGLEVRMRSGLFFLSLLALAAVIVRAQTSPQAGKTLDLTPHVNYGTPSPEKDLPKELVTKERLVTIQGVKYKQIQYNGETYTVNAAQPESIVDCSRTALPQDTYAAEATYKVTKHTGLFMASLRQQCDEKSHSVTTSSDLRDSNIGVKFKGDGPNATEKRVFVNPLKKMGSVSTEF